jgi:hypothetical protein
MVPVPPFSIAAMVTVSAFKRPDVQSASTAQSYGLMGSSRSRVGAWNDGGYDALRRMPDDAAGIAGLRRRPLYEDSSGDDLRRRGPSLQSPLSADVWTRMCDHRGAPPFQTYINGSCWYLPRMSISMVA